jgi:hypothetical protein
MKVIPLKYGTMFKQAFSQPDVFCQFVEDILDIKFNATQIHTEYEYPKPIGFVRSKYDLFAEDVEQRIIVEIQHVKQDDFFDRFLYYHLISMVEQVGGCEEYGFDRTVYTIVVLTSTPRDGTINFSCAISDMNPINEYDKTIKVYPHRLVFLCPRQVNDKTPKKIREWLKFIEDSLDGEMDKKTYPNKLWQKIMDAIRKQDIDPELLSEIKDEAAWEKAKKRFITEGKREGRREGIVKGRREGIIDSIQKQLSLKFKLNLPKKYKEKLDAMTLEQLEIVSEKIITSDTLEDIFN